MDRKILTRKPSDTMMTRRLAGGFVSGHTGDSPRTTGVYSIQAQDKQKFNQQMVLNWICRCLMIALWTRTLCGSYLPRCISILTWLVTGGVLKSYAWSFKLHNFCTSDEQIPNLPLRIQEIQIRKHRYKAWHASKFSKTQSLNARILNLKSKWAEPTFNKTDV